MRSLRGSVLFCVYFHFKKQQTNISCLIIFNKKEIKKKEAKKVFYLKTKFNQVPVIAMSDLLFLHQVLENSILHPIIN